MQLTPISATDRLTALAQPVDGTGATQRIEPPVTVAAAPRAANAPAPTPRQGLRVWAPDLNSQVANAQQSLDYLDALAAQLQSVKAQASLKLSGSYVRDGTLEKQQQRLVQLWHERPEKSAYRLDAQLEYSGDTPTLQHFRIRGLDQRSLQASGPETLAFTLDGFARQSIAVRIDSGLPLPALASRFDQALAPAGIRVRATAQGELDFTVQESQWPQLRDGLGIKGGGKRFPTGQFSSAPVQPSPGIIEPSAWQLDHPAGLREALPQTVRAAQQTSAVRTTVQRTLAQADRSLDLSDAARHGPETHAYSQIFLEQTRQANYPLLSALSPSLLGLPRYRIENLLALK